MIKSLATPSSSAVQCAEYHLQRVHDTLEYAIAQDNNHGTSEAATLFIAGAWLFQNTQRDDFRIFSEKGRFWLENRIEHLVSPKGGFSQYSVNYRPETSDSLST